MILKWQLFIDEMRIYLEKNTEQNVLLESFKSNLLMRNGRNLLFFPFEFI